MVIPGSEVICSLWVRYVVDVLGLVYIGTSYNFFSPKLQGLGNLFFTFLLIFLQFVAVVVVADVYGRDVKFVKGVLTKQSGNLLNICCSEQGLPLLSSTRSDTGLS